MFYGDFDSIFLTDKQETAIDYEKTENEIKLEHYLKIYTEHLIQNCYTEKIAFEKIQAIILNDSSRKKIVDELIKIRKLAISPSMVIIQDKQTEGV